MAHLGIHAPPHDPTAEQVLHALPPPAVSALKTRQAHPPLHMLLADPDPLAGEHRTHLGLPYRRWPRESGGSARSTTRQRAHEPTAAACTTPSSWTRRHATAHTSGGTAGRSGGSLRRDVPVELTGSRLRREESRGAPEDVALLLQAPHPSAQLAQLLTLRGRQSVVALRAIELLLAQQLRIDCAVAPRRGVSEIEQFQFSPICTSRSRVRGLCVLAKLRSDDEGGWK